MTNLVATIPLSKGRFHAIVDCDVFPLIAQGNWSACVKSNGMPYGVKMIDGHIVYLHRHVLLATGVVIPKGMVVDHINRNPLDNRLQNLRVVTQEQNMNNITRPGTGVRKYRQRWTARIFIHNREVSLGTYDTRDEAVAARSRADAKKQEELWG